MRRQRSPVARGALTPSTVVPPSALLVYLCETHLRSERPGHGLVPARINIDLFRAIPKKPLRGEAELQRSSRRLALGRSRLSDGNTTLAEATVLFLSPSADRDARNRVTVPQREPLSLPSPDELPSVTMAPGNLGLPPGFHFEVDTRWLPIDSAQARPLFGAWVRFDGHIIDDELPTPLQRVALLADFANAVSGRARMRVLGAQTAFGFINCDNSIYFEGFPIRLDDDGWLCLVAEESSAEHGVGHARVGAFGADGRLGTVLQSSLAQVRGR